MLQKGMRKPKLPDNRWGELEEVEQWYRKEKDINLKSRLNAIRLLMKGLPLKDVAEVIGVSRRTLGNWRRQWDESGKEGLKSQHKGRKSKVTPAMRADIEEVIEIKQEIDGKIVTGYLIHGYLKKNTS